jgi:hypothetical protein
VGNRVTAPGGLPYRIPVTQGPVEGVIHGGIPVYIYIGYQGVGGGEPVIGCVPLVPPVPIPIPPPTPLTRTPLYTLTVIKYTSYGTVGGGWGVYTGVRGVGALGFMDPLPIEALYPPPVPGTAVPSPRPHQGALPDTG